MFAETPTWGVAQLGNLGETGLVNRTNSFDTADFQQRLSSLERKVGYGYNVLAEVDLLLRALTTCPNNAIDLQARDRVIEDELTGACEAVGSRYGGMWSSYRPWDAATCEFRAFGASFISMLQVGVDDMRQKVEEDGIAAYRFELNRRQAELGTEQEIRQSYQQGQIDNQIFLTISPYPEEVAEEIAASLGYKVKERLGKLRFEVFVNRVRQTIELGVAKGSVRIFQQLVEQLGYHQAAFPDSASFLRTPILVEGSTDYLNTILNLAKRYDALLENNGNSTLYFCGQSVSSVQEKAYDQIVERQRWVRERGKGLVEGIYNLDLELAKSLLSGVPTKQITEALRYWTAAKDQKGTPLLDGEQLRILDQVIGSGLISRNAAFILKKNELVRMWSIMACVINEDKARQLFGERHVSLIRGMIESATINTPQARYFVDQMIAEINPIFLACGGSLNSFGGQKIANLFQMSLSAVTETLFGARDEYGSLVFQCEYCEPPKGRNIRPYGKLLTHYQCCGRAISQC